MLIPCTSLIGTQVEADAELLQQMLFNLLRIRSEIMSLLFRLLKNIVSSFRHGLPESRRHGWQGWPHPC
ncbi:MAG: hypothetical protein RL563_680, partial [Pseudomonadota bacterium]